jgi:hypothetical protein
MDLKIFQIDSVANSGINTPEMIDFTHIGLFPKQYASKGLIDKVEYYRYLDSGVYSELIVEKVYSYTFAGGIYTGIGDTVNWYDLDDNIGYSVAFYRTLLPFESIEFGAKKRSNIIGTVKIYTLSQIGLVNGYDLIDTITPQISIYIQGPITPLTDAIQALVGVKAYMTQQLATTLNTILNDV